MKDLYSFHADEADLDRFYDLASQVYKKIYDRIGIGDKTYFTYASGGTFSKYSHEFQTLCDAGEDDIFICDICKIAVNKEIIDDLEHKCPVCKSENLRSAKASEVGNIFKLKTKFSDPFDLKFTNENGESISVIMGCYGIGPGRVMGVVVETNHDENGIIWPESIAPFKVHLISLGENDAAENIYSELTAAGVEVLYDDREGISAGEKFADSDLIGIPYRMLVSKKTLAESSVEVKRRNSDEAELVKRENILNY
jgi:prolyl-tRNA synthetase